MSLSLLISPSTKPFFPLRKRERAMECCQVRLSILILNVLFFECFLGVAWRLFRIKMVERKSYTCEFKLSVTQWTLENGKNISSASRKFNGDRKRIRECLKQEERSSESKKWK